MFFHKKKKKIKIGLTLGSGGARGLAHIGVIKVLEENGIQIFCIAGSSIGALVGGLYAATHDVSGIEKLASQNDWKKILDLVWDPTIKGGLISGKKIENFIRKHLKGVKFSDLKIPFNAAATNFKTGEPVYIGRGDVASAVRSSLSVPLIFNLVSGDGKLLADGGLSDPVPVQAARRMGADLVIAVNLDNYRFSNHGKIGFFEAADNSLNILRYHLAQEKIKNADVVIEPKVSAPSLIGWRQFMNSKKIIAEGERAAREVMPAIKKLMRD